MKEIRYYILVNSKLFQILKDDEVVKNYSSSESVHKLLKVEILPVDIKIAPLKELPDYYANRRRILLREEKQRWEESRILAHQPSSKKRTNKKVFLWVNEKSKSYHEEPNWKNDPRNRVDLSKGIFNKRKRSKRPPPQIQNET